MKKNTHHCSLCDTPTQEYMTFREKRYVQCPTCEAIQMHSNDFITHREEKAHYETHENDVNNVGYQRFVSPIVDAVTSNYTPEQKGLDFGAGTGPVITKLLQDQGYDMTLYDPYFWKNPDALTRQYDFIVSCEVIEHFYCPIKEFTLLKTLLQDKGSIFIMTDLLTDDVKFETWYYKNDPTHVFFYRPQTLEWIQKHLGFKDLSINNRLIQFKL